MIKFLFIFIILLNFLKADIIFNDSCLGYKINVSITSNRYSDFYCFDNEALVWDRNLNRYLRVMPISGIEFTGISIQRLDNQNRYLEQQWFSVPPVQIKKSTDENLRLLYGLLGILLGFLTIQILYRIILKRS